MVFTSVGGAGTTNRRSSYAVFPETSRLVPNATISILNQKTSKTLRNIEPSALASRDTCTRAQFPYPPILTPSLSLTLALASVSPQPDTHTRTCCPLARTRTSSPARPCTVSLPRRPRYHPLTLSCRNEPSRAHSPSRVTHAPRCPIRPCVAITVALSHRPLLSRLAFSHRLNSRDGRPEGFVHYNLNQKVRGKLRKQSEAAMWYLSCACALTPRLHYCIVSQCRGQWGFHP